MRPPHQERPNTDACGAPHFQPGSEGTFSGRPSQPGGHQWRGADP